MLRAKYENGMKCHEMKIKILFHPQINFIEPEILEITKLQWGGGIYFGAEQSQKDS
jgi:hypothetical protein